MRGKNPLGENLWVPIFEKRSPEEKKSHRVVMPSLELGEVPLDGRGEPPVYQDNDAGYRTGRPAYGQKGTPSKVVRQLKGFADATRRDVSTMIRQKGAVESVYTKRWTFYDLPGSIMDGEEVERLSTAAPRAAVSGGRG
ncbi:hypothetical protein FGG08_005632 [Glutinoglossum americanum]|uniref:Uncharacterized protein n=1 Tax=Glutinoglossum americanum TaxID=1670608 RepID=A0A9P8KVV1_9PEZI|nr:hypothetical protein FGG08_005632 [Glutinoglossum americanum]